MRISHIILLLLIISTNVLYAQLMPVPVTGFNQDAIADGNVAAAASTTIPNGFDQAGWSFVAQNFIGNPTCALPLSRVIPNAQTPGLSYILGDYSQNNCLHLTANGIPGTLNFDAMRSASQVYVLGCSGSGSSTANIVVNFADGTNQTFTNITNFGDWFFTAGVANAVGRVSVNSNQTECATTGPNFLQAILTISPQNTLKPITSITITRTAATGTSTTLGIFAVGINFTGVSSLSPFTTAPIANFAYDAGIDTVWVNSPHTFVNTSTMDSVRYWDIEDVSGNRICLPPIGCFLNSSVFPNNKNFRYTFTQTGFYNVKLIVRNRFGTDSITKRIYVGLPTRKPIADFFADVNRVGIGNQVPFYDFSKNGPTSWQWSLKPQSVSVFDTNAFVPNATNPIPQFLGKDLGLFDVCLKVTNNIGSDSVCKTKYMEVVSATVMCQTSSFSNEASSFLYSPNGPLNSYNPATFNNTCDYLIDPCAASVTAVLDKLKLRSRDSLVFRDGGPTGPIIRTIGGNILPALTLRTITANTGRLHIQWKLNNNLPVTAGDTGFILSWSSIGVPYGAPTTRFTSADTIYTSQSLGLFNQSAVSGTPVYSWDTNGDGVFGDATTPDANVVFNDTIPTYKNICLRVTNCKGNNTFCKQVLVLPIVFRPQALFSINMKTGFTTDAFRLNDVSKNGVITRTWTITPNNFSNITFLQGTNANSTNPLFRVNIPGKYSVKLVVTNAFGVDSIIGTEFFEVLSYPSPDTELPLATTSDVGITNVRFADINETTALKTPTYHRIFETKMANVFRGVSYQLSVSRSTAVSPMNRKVWIDFNLDGDFLDAGELVIDEINRNTFSATTTFTVPTTIAVGRIIRLRVGVTEGATSLTPDKATSGCFEDYAMLVGNDFVPPTILLNGNNPHRVEVNKPFIDPGATATDNLEGNISNRIQTISNIDTSLAGTYTIRYFVLDLYGNSSDTISRSVQVEVNQTGPVITLNGSDTVYLEALQPYADLGATAKTNTGGDITSKLKVLGNVNNKALGTYLINFSVVDNFGFTAEKNRVVIVRDTKAPVITTKYGSNTIRHQINTPYTDANIVVTDAFYAPNQITLTRVGIVYDNVAAGYNIQYTACDPSGNCSPVFFVLVNVEDTIPPTVKLLGDNPMVVDVFEPFEDPKVIASDNYYAANSLITITNSLVDINKVGSYNITYTVRDGAGNQTTLTRQVVVADRKAPVIELLGSNPFVMLRFKDFNDPGIKITDNYQDEASLQAKLLVTSNMTVRNGDTLWGDLTGWRWVRYQVRDDAGNLSEIVERTIQIVPNTGLFNQQTNNTLSVYPNPSNGNFTITAGQVFNSTVQMALFDAAGARVMVQDIENPASNTITIKANIKPGLYLVQLMHNNQTSYAKITVW